MSITVVVEPAAARSPAMRFRVEPSFFGDVGECSVTVIVEKNVVSPEATEQIVPAIVIVIAHAYACLPARSRQSGFFRDVGKGAVAIIFVQL